MEKLKAGKLPHNLLARLLRKFELSNPDILLGPGVGLDSAVIKMGDNEYLVVASDPITFTAEDIGFYLVTVNANDVAVTGARPEFLIVDLLLPEGEADEEVAEKVFDQIANAAKSQGISVIGGHTEVTFGLDRVIAVGTMLGRLKGRAPITSSRMRPGDLIILTRGIAIEGTAILAREKQQELKAAVDEETLEKAARFIFEPGISIVKEALIAAQMDGVHAMHDPTEGGVATALHEMCMASGTGALIRFEKLKIYPETEAFCSVFGIDPLGLIASGALLISVAPESAEQLLNVLAKNGIDAHVIGEVKPIDFGVKIERHGRVYNLPIFSQDEITKVI